MFGLVGAEEEAYMLNKPRREVFHIIKQLKQLITPLEPPHRAQY